MSEEAPHAAARQAMGSVADRLGTRIDRLPAWGLPHSSFVLPRMAYLLAFHELSVIGVALAPTLEELGLPKSASAGPSSCWGSAGLRDLDLQPRTPLRFSRPAGRPGPQQHRARPGQHIDRLLLGPSLADGLPRIDWAAAMGAVSSFAATITGKFAGRTEQGRAISANTLRAVSVFITPLRGLTLLPFAHIGWRLVLAVSGLSALLLMLYADPMLPQSPRWLAMQGHTDDASDVASTLKEHVYQQY